MKMKIAERVFLIGLFPMTGKYENLILFKSIDNKIRITSDEVSEYKIESTETGLKWNEKGGNSEIEVEFNDAEKILIVETLKKASESDKLPVDLINIYELIVLKNNTL